MKSPSDNAATQAAETMTPYRAEDWACAAALLRRIIRKRSRTSPGQLWVLLRLARPDDSTAECLAADLGVRRETVNVWIDQMRRAGLITVTRKGRSPGAGAVRQLTDAGIEFLTGRRGGSEEGGVKSEK